MNKPVYRAQILLEPKQHEALVRIARLENRSLSDVVREMLDHQLSERKKEELSVAAQALLQDTQKIRNTPLLRLWMLRIFILKGKIWLINFDPT